MKGEFSGKKCCATALLIASLLLNAFFVGMVVDKSMRSHPFRPHDMHAEMFRHLEDALSVVDPANRQKVQDLIDQKKTATRADMDKVDQTFPEIHAVLTADKFDPAKLREVHNRLQGYDAAMKDDLLSLMTGIAQILPDKERIAFFQKFGPVPPKPPGAEMKDDGSQPAPAPPPSDND